MRERGRFTGAWLIVRFNWPLYAAALAVIAGAVAVLALADAPRWKIAAFVVFAGAAWFLVGSLAASHIVYDRSGLHRGKWLTRALPQPPLRIAICHCGYDEISALVRERLPNSALSILDHYDDATMSEPSIRRARRLFPPAGSTTSAPHAVWPVGVGAFDAILGVLAIHELRSHTARAAWFSESRRCLAADGRIIIVEHLRDFANFAAFGPGFVHFHSVATWRRAWESAGLHCADTFRITPFVRIFVLHRHD
jgi:hypothetical protein